jgi:hypothetical protein
MLDIRHAEEFLIVDVASGFVHSRLLADLIGDGRADIVGFGDAEGALIEVASRHSPCLPGRWPELAAGLGTGSSDPEHRPSG